jgi:hypothetical protein
MNQMKIARAVSIGVMAALVTGTCLAQTAAIEFPLERQVLQRNAEEWAEVKVSGTGPKTAALVEAKATLAAGLRGEALAWTVVARPGHQRHRRQPRLPARRDSFRPARSIASVREANNS